MKNIKFSKQASLDIEEIYLYGFISFGEEQADIYAFKMQKFLEMMRSNPEIGVLSQSLTKIKKGCNIPRLRDHSIELLCLG